jgi:hypothetical protein
MAAWLQENGLPSLMMLILVGLVIIIVTTTILVAIMGLPRNAELEAVRAIFQTLTSEQKDVLRRLLPLGGLPPNAISDDERTNLEHLYQNAQFVVRRDAHYFVNKDMASRLSLLLRCDEIERRYWYETPENDLAPKRVTDLLNGQQLEVRFDADLRGCIDHFRGISLDKRETVNFDLYRVAVRSSATARGTRLRVVGLTLKGSGRHYPSLPLRVMGDHKAVEYKLHPNTPQFWDVIDKPVGSDWMRLTHTVDSAGEIIFQAPQELTVIASSDEGFSTTKIIKLDVERDNNNALVFWMGGTGQQESGNPVLGLAQKSAAVELVERLAAFRVEGNELLGRFSIDRTVRPYTELFEDWKNRVQTYLDGASTGYARRFRSKTIDYPYTGAASARTRTIANEMFTRIMRLEEFIKERTK